MTTTEDRSSDASRTARAGSVDTKLEVLVIPSRTSARALMKPELLGTVAMRVVWAGLARDS